jgi:hypothetical protein
VTSTNVSGGSSGEEAGADKSAGELQVWKLVADDSNSLTSGINKAL